MDYEYDVNLYKEMANFSVNEIVEVSNRKGRKSTIHITNITKLTWPELQLLPVSGTNKFSKMVCLYKALSESIINGKTLSSQEVKEIEAYIKIYRDYGCIKHHEVNEIITQQEIWDNFTTIRSLNDHGESTGIKGIQPDYYGIVCSILKISGEDGSPLDGYTKY
jgi:hypothetical protein